MLRIGLAIINGLCISTLITKRRNCKFATHPPDEHSMRFLPRPKPARRREDDAQTTPAAAVPPAEKAIAALLEHGTQEKAAAAAGISPVTGHPLWESRVLGNFPKQSQDALISLTWLEQAKQRELRADQEECHLTAGIDVAGPGEDETYSQSGRGTTSLRSVRFANKMRGVS